MAQFDVQADVSTLSDALNNSNKDALINILCSRNVSQRMEIVAAFNETSEIPLETQFKSRFDGDFQKIMLALVMNPIEFYADELNTAFDKLQSRLLNILGIFSLPKYNTIANILSPLSNREIDELKSLYEKRYSRKLEKDIDNCLSLQLKDLLLEICKSDRDETDNTDLDAAVNDATELFRENNPYNDDYVTVFLEIFTKRNFQQLSLIFDEFKKLTHEPIETHIESLFKQEDVLGYRTIVEYSEDKDFYLARCLFDGLDSGNSSLIGLVVLQGDDLLTVKRLFERNFKDSLRDFISSKTSKHYKYALYALFGETRSNN